MRSILGSFILLAAFSTTVRSAPQFPFGNMFPIPNLFPPMVFPVPWYRGENVCKDQRLVPDSPEVAAMMADGSGDTRSSSESCNGNDDIYICQSRIVQNGKSTMIVTKYSCCEGFVRQRGAPGCVKP